MNKKKYYENKITYALSKIEYAQNKLKGRKHKNIMPAVYLVLSNYKEVDVLTLSRATKLSQKEVRYALRVLKEMGLVDWQGKYLREDKSVAIDKIPTDFVTFVKDLNEKYHSKYGKELIKTGKKPKAKAKAIRKKTFKKEKKEQIAWDYEEWVEIMWDEDVIIKAKKSKLKKLLGL